MHVWIVWIVEHTVDPERAKIDSSYLDWLIQTIRVTFEQNFQAGRQREI